MLPQYQGRPINAADLLIGHKLDQKYQLEAPLGMGSTGIVYRARRLLIGDEVALKVLHPRLVADARMIERFRREALAVNRLNHPGVAAIYDFGTSSDGLVYLAMELVEGESLRDLLRRRGSLDEASALEIATQVCDVLAEAHKQDIVHRDIKPENIIVRQTETGWRVKLLDFGIAALRNTGSNKLTDTGGVVGTPYYMSPEQCLGEQLDGRSDIYSLGVVLYELLSGVLPFNSPVVTAVIVNHVNMQPARLREHKPELSPALAAVVMRALEKKREARPQSATAFAQELLKAARKQKAVSPTTMMGVVPTQPFKQSALPAQVLETTRVPVAAARSGKQARRAMPVVFATLLVLLAAGAGFWWQRNQTRLALARTVYEPELSKPTPEPEPVVNHKVWTLVADQTKATSDAANALSEPDQKLAVIAPGGQLALAFNAGQFFGDGKGADLLIHGAAEQPVSYLVFVRNDASGQWQRIDVNRRTLPQGVKGHDMGHHNVKQGCQVLIRNEASTALQIDAVSVVYQDVVANAPQHRHQRLQRLQQPKRPQRSHRH
jgi:hypothetical protein